MEQNKITNADRKEFWTNFNIDLALKSKEYREQAELELSTISVEEIEDIELPSLKGLIFSPHTCIV